MGAPTSPEDETFLASQAMGAENDYVPTDEEMRELHYDGALWSEPEDQGKNFDRWIAAHDAALLAKDEELQKDYESLDDESEARLLAWQTAQKKITRLQSIIDQAQAELDLVWEPTENVLEARGILAAASTT